MAAVDATRCVVLRSARRNKLVINYPQPSPRRANLRFDLRSILNDERSGRYTSKTANQCCGSQIGFDCWIILAACALEKFIMHRKVNCGTRDQA